MDEEFLAGFYRELDRTQLFDATVNQLRMSGVPLTISELAAALPPSHDLETCILAGNGAGSRSRNR